MSHIDDFVITFIAGSDVPLRINGKEYSAGKGDILVLVPNVILEYTSSEQTAGLAKITTSIDLVMELPSPFDTDFIAAARRFPLIRPSSSELEWMEKMYAMLETVYADKEGMYRNEILKSAVNFALKFAFPKANDYLRVQIRLSYICLD